MYGIHTPFPFGSKVDWTWEINIMLQPIFLSFWHPNLHLSTGINGTWVSQDLCMLVASPGIFKDDWPILWDSNSLSCCWQIKTELPSSSQWYIPKTFPMIFPEDSIIAVCFPLKNQISFGLGIPRIFWGEMIDSDIIHIILRELFWSPCSLWPISSESTLQRPELRIFYCEFSLTVYSFLIGVEILEIFWHFTFELRFWSHASILAWSYIQVPQ